VTTAQSDILDRQGLDNLRPGLVGYCYRMLGSAFEADDAVQETLLRAWQSRESFAGRSALRTWLYRIATNVCIDVLRSRARRAMPMDLGPAATQMGEIEPSDYPWMSPLPDHHDPADVVVEKESIRLAFVAALQYLPARPRAVLILRDVLGWPAAEVAELLEASTASVHTALRRARASLAEKSLDASPPNELSAQDRELLAGYVDAFERYDINALVALLHADAIQSMPPYALWLRGAEAIGAFMLGPGAECRGSRLVATSANGAPAFGQYRQGGRLPWALQVLQIRDGRIAELHCFLDTDLFARFGLPPTL
jgi:RNA polymerase sigma-70 factor (ECF subfamily)